MNEESACPALYIRAEEISARRQNEYFRLIAMEYAALSIAAVLALDFSRQAVYFIVYAAIIIAALATMSYRSWAKPEKQWYRARALAESIKTSAWRYAMNAEPFIGSEKELAEARFSKYVQHILDENHDFSKLITPISVGMDQITEQMTTTRLLSLSDRQRIYLKGRVQEQKAWYALKSRQNYANGEKWAKGSYIVYALTIVSVLVRIAFPEWHASPTEPLLVVASSLVGWIQARRYNELGSAYALTTHEIGLIEIGFRGELDEVGFSEAVNTAELAFSREHTQWVARTEEAY